MGNMEMNGGGKLKKKQKSIKCLGQRNFIVKYMLLKCNKTVHKS